MNNKNRYKISVVIPAFNAEKTIINALDSIENQTLKEIEVIIIDDGSIDKTKALVLLYISNHPEMKILFLEQKNQGPGAARNRGLEVASGDYIAFMDADDTAPVGAYHALYYTAFVQNSDIVIGNYLRQVNKEKWYVPQYIKELCAHKEGQNCAGEYQIAINNPSLWNRIYKREFLNFFHIRFLEEMHGEDVVFNLDATRYAKRIYTTNAIVYYYHKQTQLQQSVSTSWSYKNTVSWIRSIKKYIMFFDQIGDVDTEIVYFQTELAYLLDGLKTILDKNEREELFSLVKNMILPYKDNSKYLPFVEQTIGVDSESFFLLPYNSYQKLKKAKEVQWIVHNEIPQNKNLSSNICRDIVALQFQNGQIGFRYLFRYFKGWISYKLKK